MYFRLDSSIPWFWIRDGNWKATGRVNIDVSSIIITVLQKVYSLEPSAEQVLKLDELVLAGGQEEWQPVVELGHDTAKAPHVNREVIVSLFVQNHLRRAVVTRADIAEAFLSTAAG